MTRRSIEVPGLHHGGVPIPQACVVGNLLTSSGISPLDPATGAVPDSTEEQVELVLPTCAASWPQQAAGRRTSPNAPSSCATKGFAPSSTSTGQSCSPTRPAGPRGTHCAPSSPTRYRSSLRSSPYWEKADYQ